MCIALVVADPHSLVAAMYILLVFFSKKESKQLSFVLSDLWIGPTVNRKLTFRLLKKVFRPAFLL